MLVYAGNEGASFFSNAPLIMVLLFSRLSGVRTFFPTSEACIRLMHSANSSVAASAGGPLDPLACRLMSFMDGPPPTVEVIHITSAA